MKDVILISENFVHILFELANSKKLNTKYVNKVQSLRKIFIFKKY
jgi:hypothetical protein